MSGSAMQYSRTPHWGYIIITVILAVLLTVIPLPVNVRNVWPDWISLLVIYWVLVLPSHLGVAFGWMNGLLEDIISFTLLGEHAISKALLGTVVAIGHKKMRLFNTLLMMFVVLILESLSIGITSLVNMLALDTPVDILLWQPALTTALVWPIFSFLLDQFDPGSR